MAKQRFIKSVIAAAKQPTPALPWERKRRVAKEAAPLKPMVALKKSA